ncbi:MAG: D-alanyl-D-alanine carboxypeptidase/D-alanyl-D-alanine-endopeptidase [Cyanobacteria bacterium P01_C01_bin.73]
MKYHWLTGLLLLGLGGYIQPAQAAICPEELGARVDAILADNPQLQRASLGFYVETIGDRTLVFSRDGNRFFVPASNQKLFTTAAAVDALGPDFQIQTVVQGRTNDFGLTTLRIVGGGDPSFGDEQLTDLAQQLTGQGISQVSDLIGDDSHFPGSPVNQNWEWEDVQAGYGAPVNSLIINRNQLGLTFYPTAAGEPVRVEWNDPAIADDWQVINNTTTLASGEPGYVYVGRDLSRPIVYARGSLVAGGRSDWASIAIPDPAQYFIERFERTLESANIAVSRTEVSTEPATVSMPVLASITSPPLSQLMLRINRNSDNLYAEAVLKTLGIEASQNRPADATAAGTTAVKRVLQELGVAPDAYVQVDGSGLSRHNLTTPEALVSVLQVMARSPHAGTFRNSLSQAGVNGSLRNSFNNSAIAQKVWGKTGWLSRNAALSGYVEPPNHPPLAFSLLLNNADTRSSVIGQVMDEIVLLLGELQSCS